MHPNEEDFTGKGNEAVSAVKNALTQARTLSHQHVKALEEQVRRQTGARRVDLEKDALYNV